MWYVDLVTIDRDQQGSYVLRDLFIDVMIREGAVPRMLDLDEIADAREAGWISTAQLLDGFDVGNDSWIGTCTLRASRSAGSVTSRRPQSARWLSFRSCSAAP